jgi:predicted ATPase/DNA-binding XRE family transcriptional regulator
MTVEASAAFGEQLRAFRTAAGMTQERLAEEAGLSVQAIAALENGRSRRPQPHTLRALSDAMRLAPEQRGALAAAVPRRVDGGSPRSVPARASAEFRSPAASDDLIGRERDLAAIEDALHRGARILTITGPGGVGKTTLAAALATRCAGRYPDGVVVVPLASVDDPALVFPTIAHAVQAPETGVRSAREALVAFLAGKRMLLVLDNLEQVLAAAPAIADLARVAAGTTLVVTSRAPLRVAGEQEYPVQPLPVPVLARVPGVEDVAGNSAVELFVARARAVSPGFHLERANAAVVAAICRRLEGLPLAIELAAARLRLLTPMELLSRLDTALPLLSGGARDLPERQRTMRDAIAWSHDLLDEREQRLFRRLAVFRGGWTLAAAEDVATGDDLSAGEVFDLLAALVEQSLVVAWSEEDASRYRLLVPVQEFAAERLELAGEAGAVRRRHAMACLALTGQAADGIIGPRQVEWLARLEVARDNLRAAFQWLLDAGEWDLASQLGWNLWTFWWVHGYHIEGREFMSRILDEGGELPPLVRARALGVAGEMAFGQADLDRATEAGEESAALFAAAGDALSAARVGLVLGLIAIARNDLDAARRRLEPAAVVFRAAGTPHWASLVISALGMLPFREGDYDRAEVLLAEGRALSTEAGDRFSRYIALYNASRLALARGDLDHAAALFLEGVRFSLEANDRANVAYCLEGLAAIAVAQDRHRLAARLLGGAHALFETVGGRVYTYRPDGALRERTEAAARARLDAAEWEAAWAEGAVMPMDELIALGETLADRPRRAGCG